MDYSRAVRAPRGAVVCDETSVDRTVCIEADNDSKVLDILQALLLKVGANTLAGVQPRGRGVYDVAFNTTAAYQDALAWDLEQDSSCLRAVSASNGLTRVRILATPMHWKWGPLLDALAEYGEVRQHFYETFQGYPTIRNGTRVVLIKLNKDKVLEDSIKVEQMTIRLDYPGVTKSCFYCRKIGHMVRDCPKKALLALSSASTGPVEAPLLVETPMSPEPVVFSPPDFEPSGPSSPRGLKRKEDEVSPVVPDEPYLSAAEGDPAMDFGELVIAEVEVDRALSSESWSSQMDAAVPLTTSDPVSSSPVAAGDSPTSRPESRNFRNKVLKNAKSKRTPTPSLSPSRRSHRPSTSKGRPK